jgi:hypothetical protein
LNHATRSTVRPGGIGILIAAGIAALGLLFALVNRDSETRELVALVESIANNGDLVLLTPRDRYPDLTLFAPEIDAIASDTLPEEVTRFARVILVHEAEPEPRSLLRLLGDKAEIVEERAVGALRVGVFEIRQREIVRSDLGQTLQNASVWVEPDDTPRHECPWLVDRFDCPDADWTWVGPTTQTFEGQPVPCIWSHPVEDAELVIEFPNAAGATHVTGWYGLTDYAVAIADGSPVTLTLEADDQSRRFRAHRQRGRRPVRMALPEEYEGPLQIRISATRPGVRHLCWDLQFVTIDPQ